jgi:hypothetical protein
MSIKEKFMNEMMGNQFKNMTSEERKQMTDDEKKDMMSGMMGKMMGNNPMMSMMSMMMGRKGQKSERGDDKGKMPWDMCCEMMTGMKETANTAKFATSELRGLFDEWCQQIEKELLDFIKEKGSIKIPEMAEKFSLSEESIKYLLSRLANKNLVDYKV